MTVPTRALTRGPEIHVLYRQSNALGRKETLSPAPAGLPRSDIYYWYRDIAFAAQGVQELDDLAPTNWVGAELTLGVELVDIAGRDVAIAKIARGSTGPDEWDPADPTKNSSIMAADLRAFIRTLRTLYARDPYVASATFIGGEEEAKTTPAAAAMQSTTEAQVARVRDDFGPGLPHWIADLPTVVVGRADADVALVNAGIAAAVAADANLRLLTVSDLPRDGEDHYTVGAQGSIGTRLRTDIAAVPAYDPDGDAGAVRVSLYPSLARAQYAARHLGYATVRVAPVDALWAVEDSRGGDWVSAAAWAVVP